MNVDLKPKKSFIKDELTSILDAMEYEEEEQIEDDSDEEIEDQKSDKSRRKNVKAKGAGGGLAAVKELSPAMASFMRKSSAARTEVVKELWAYIKKKNLQNPRNRKEIICNDGLKEIFGVDKMTMFTLNKYVGAHIHPFVPVNLTELSENSKKRKAEQVAKKSKEPKKRNTGIHAPWYLSNDLSAIVGKRILSRTEVTQGLWAYIKEHKLQDPEDKRQIICDELFSKVMGGRKKVTMFSMTKFISSHLLEEATKSESDDHDSNQQDSD